MSLISDAEAQDILTRLGQLENIIAGMAKKADVITDLGLVQANITTLRTEIGAVMIRYVDLKVRYQELGNRVAALE